MSRPKVWKTLFSAAVLVLLSVASVWAVLGQKAAEKILTSLAMPCGILWVLLTCAVYLAFRDRSRTFLLFAVIWILFTVTGNGFLSTQLADSLERPYRSIRPFEEQPFDTIVVLGGGVSQGANERQQGNGSGDRLILTAQMYHAGLAESLICTGRRIESMNSSGFDPSEQSQNVLLSLGVPDSAIKRLGGRTTSEEMKTLGERFAASGDRVGVVTSAWHLPRALRLAEKNGFHPVPLPADFMTGPPRELTIGETINAMIPQGGSFMAVARVTKEYLGMMVGR